MSEKARRPESRKGCSEQADLEVFWRSKVSEKYYKILPFEVFRTL